MAKRPIAADDVAKRPISSHRYKALKSCSNMQWYECWHSEGVAPQFTKPPFFPLEETGGYCYIIGMLIAIVALTCHSEVLVQNDTVPNVQATRSVTRNPFAVIRVALHSQH